MPRLIVGLALGGALLAGPRVALAQDTGFASCPPSDAAAARFLGSTIEPVPDKPGTTRTHLSGDVVLPCGDMTLFADEVIFDKNTNILEAFGHVYLQQTGMSLYGDHAIFNRLTRLGTFYNAWGFAQIGEKAAQKSMFGTLEPDVWFWGEQIERTGEKTYRLTRGGFTTCVQPSRRWEMTTTKGTITLDKRVFMRGVVLKVKDVPMLYLPAMYYPINKEGRSTGFLMPQYGSSTYLGTSLSNAFFWAINRSQDATLYYDWYAKTGQGFASNYRYVASPGSQGEMTLTVRDNRAQFADDGVTQVAAASKSYNINANANQTLPHNFHLLGNVQYFTDVAAQQAYQDVNAMTSRQRSFNGTLSGNVGPYRISAGVNQSDYFDGTTAGQRTGRDPSLSIALNDKPIGHSKIYFGASGETDYLVRQDNLADPTTNRSLWRFDGGPRMSATFSSLSYLSATASASWDVTRWWKSVDPATGSQVAVPLTRQLLTLQATFTGPTLSRIFQTPDSRYAERFKHVIEPTLSITHTSPFDELDRVVILDGVDGNIGGVTTVRYGVTNRLLAKRKGPNGSPGSAATIREILSVDINQSYYTDALASMYDPEYQSVNEANETTPTGRGTFSAVQLNAIFRPTDLASAQMRLNVDPKFKALQTMSGSGSLESRRVQVTGTWTKQFVIEGDPQYSPDFASDSLGATTTIKTLDNHIGGAYSLYYDFKQGGFTQQRILAYYNSQCCGVSIDWQSVSTPLLPIPYDRRLGISFTLAGLGSFANPLGSFGGGR